MLQSGNKIDPIHIHEQGGKSIRLDFKGTNVIFFYPKDDTPGCTKEACSFRDDMEIFKKRDVKIYGVSLDSHESHEKFKKKYGLNFYLISDKEKKMCEAFGVPLTLTGSAQRSTFVVKDGEIMHVWPRVSPDEHSKEVLEVLAKIG